MSPAVFERSNRGSTSYVTRDGGGTESVASHISSDRFAGSRASRWLSAVVPVRERPTMKIGASTGVRARSGCCACQPVTRKRFRSDARTAPSKAAEPMGVS